VSVITLHFLMHSTEADTLLAAKLKGKHQENVVQKKLNSI